jgi:cobalt/nickel transport system ATP-binding protein
MGTPVNAPALSYRGVTVRYGPEREPALVRVSLDVADGERVALLGLNGSGKTTLLLTAGGLLPHEGTVEIGGLPLGSDTLAEVRRRVGFLFNVPEDQLLFPRVLDDVAFGLIRQAVSPAVAAAEARRALAEMGVEGLAEASLHQLSHGEKQRVALAGALVTRPALLLLDEPSAGVDPPGRTSLAALLSGLEAAVLVATHDLEFAARVCSRFVLLDRGRVLVDGPDLDDVCRRWALHP